MDRREVLADPDRMEDQLMRTLVKASLIFALLTAVGGLAACGSSSTTQVSTATTGQQLTDLKTALDNGVISKSEYDRKRKEILKN